MEEAIEEALHMEQDTQKGKFLTFLIGEEVYAIEIKLVTEIISIQPITELPGLPAYLKGVVNIRGKIIAVMDVRLRFDLMPVEYNQRTCIVIIKVRDTSIGLIVDHVSEVLSISDENINPPPDIINGLENKIVKAIGISDENVNLILDCEQLLSGYDFKAIGSAV